jgi:hypothetical protein
MLLGICSELQIGNLLVGDQPHTRRTRSTTWRRIMFAARADASLPRDYSAALLQGPRRNRSQRRARSPRSPARFRRQFPHRGRRGRHPRLMARTVAQDALALFARLGVERDGAHAFYLGAELTKAEIAWRLGKRYAQDEPLDWGCAADAPVEDRTRLRAHGHTLKSGT